MTELGNNVISGILILTGLIVSALLVQQIWLAIRLSDRNDEWLDALKAVSDELKDLRRQAESSPGDGTGPGGGASSEERDAS